jgi:hypothetical protein
MILQQRKSGACAAASKSCFTVVPKAVDDDLYRVPSDIFHQKPALARNFHCRIGCFPL